MQLSQVQPVILERRVVSVDPPQVQQVQPPQLQAQRLVPVRSRQRPAANSTSESG